MDSAVFATFVVTLAQRKTCQRGPDKGLQNDYFFGPKSDENHFISGLWADAHQIPSPEPPGSVPGTLRETRGDTQRVVIDQLFASGRPRRALSEFILRPGRAPEASGRHPGAPLWAKMAPGGLGEGAWMVPGHPGDQF